jgi:hypothetical protein
LGRAAHRESAAGTAGAGGLRYDASAAGLNTWASAAIALVIGYTVRVPALYFAWEEPLASEPKGVYIHDDGRPVLGRKLKGKSRREMASLGLVALSARLVADQLGHSRPSMTQDVYWARRSVDSQAVLALKGSCAGPDPTSDLRVWLLERSEQCRRVRAVAR